MVLKIISQNKIPEMKRTHITAELVFEKATPSSNDVKAELSKGLKADPETIVINKIDTHFGESKASVDAFQYDSKEALGAVSRKLPKKQKEKIDAQKKKKEEAAKAAEEKPAEEPKAEEAKPEEKPAENPAEEKPEPKTEEPKAKEKPEAPVADQSEDKADASVIENKPPKSEEKSESKEKPKEESKEKSE